MGYWTTFGKTPGILEGSGAGYPKRGWRYVPHTFFQPPVLDNAAFDSAAKKVEIELAKLKEILEREA